MTLNFTTDERREIIFNKKEYPTLYGLLLAQKNYKEGGI